MVTSLDGFFDDDTCKASHRVYYNDIDIATGNLICNGEVVGNVKYRDRKMMEIDRKNNYMW